MAEFKKLENDFTGGQVSPLLSKRSNAKRHDIGLKTLQNMTIMLQGGATTRPSTEHVAQVKDSSKATRLLPFEFSTEETYTIEMGDLYFRFLKESGQILEADITITGITQANPAVVTVSGTAPANGEQLYITEVVGMTEVNHTRVYYTVANRTATTFELQDQDGVNVDSSAFTAYSSGGIVNVIYEIASTYAEADLPLIQYTQSADVISLVHADYVPRDLTRTADTSWTIADTTFVDGPYLTENATTTTLAISGTGASSITFTASSTTGINNDVGFLSTDVGRLIRWQSGLVWHYYKIITFTDSTHVVANRISTATPGGTAATEVWRLGAWSDTTGYPRTITYHQQRRFYAGTATQPSTIWGSAIDDYTNFTPGVDDSDAVEYTVSSSRVNAISWLASSARLRVGTTGGIHTLWGGSTTASLSPTNVEADEENKIKCKAIQPIQNGSVTLFAQRSGKVLRELVYDFQVDGLVAPDITLVSEDILGNIGDTSDNGVIQMAYQLEPTPTIWCAKDNGNIAALTYSRETDTVGWHNHIMGGTDPAVKDVISVPGTGQDRVWVIVSRTINGVTRQYIEQFDTHFRGSVNRLAAFSDSHVHYSGEKPATTLTPSATTGTGINFTAGGSVFASTDVGRIIQYKNGTIYSRALITAYTSPTVVVATVLRDFPNTSAIASQSWTLSTNTYDKLDHLEGETVSILADGGTKPSQTVTNGTITLTGQYTDVVIGLGYIQELELLDIDFGSAVGTAYAARGKVNEVDIDLFESMGGFIGYDENSLTEIVYRDGTDIMNEGVPLFTGSKTPRPKGGWRNSIKTLIRQVDPLPLTVLGIVIKGQVSDATG